MLRTLSRGMAVVFCLALLLTCLTGPAWNPAVAFAGGGTGGPIPPDSTGDGDSYQPPGGESPMEVSSSMSQELLYWYWLATLHY